MLFFIVITLFYCSDEKTEIVLSIYTDYLVPYEFDRIELILLRSDKELFSKEYKIESADEIPIKILITQENDSEEIIGIMVRGKKVKEIVVETYVEKTFIRHKRIYVDVFLNKESNIFDAGLEDVGDYGTDTIWDIGNTDVVLMDSDSYVEDVSELPIDAGCSISGCGNNAKCVDARCVCNKGFENCDGDWENGCEGDILNSPKYCGGCKSDCNPINVENALCLNGECSYDRCKLMYKDLDGDKKNGCEKLDYFPKVYGGDKDEFLEDMIVTKDKNILLLSTSKSCCFGDSDLYLVKLNMNGNVLWERVVGKNKEIKGPLSIVELNDGSYVVVGATDSFGVKEMAGLVIKVDKYGSIIKSKILDNGYFIKLMKIRCDNKLDCLIIGTAGVPGNTGPDVYEIILDKDFTIKSQRLFKIADMQGDSIDMVTNSYITVNEGTDGKKSIILIILDSNREVRYVKRLVSQSDLWEPNCVEIQSEGFYCTVIRGRASDSDIVLFKFLYGNNGSIVWKRAFGNKEMDLGMVSKSSDPFNIYISGTSYNNGIPVAFFSNLDLNGVVRYTKFYNGSLGDGVMYSSRFNNEIMLLGGMSFSYGMGGIDLLILPVNIKGENVSQCHFPDEGDLSFNFYEPDIILEDINIEEVLITDFQLKDVTFDISSRPDFGASSICGK